jgi:RNA polymerase sigma factor (TIGR02999 family)
VTALLRAWADGDLHARDRALSAVYGDLRRRATRYLRRECRDHTLRTSDLIHETYLRLSAQDRVKWLNRGQFFGVASQMMRRILVDHARARLAARRNRVSVTVTSADTVLLEEPAACDVLALDQALTRLSALDARQGRIVELRYFGGLSVEETADVLAISPSTVKREWRTARAWLFRHLTASLPLGAAGDG